MEETPDELMQSCRNVLIPPTLNVGPRLGDFRRDGEFPIRRKFQVCAGIMPARKNGCAMRPQETILQRLGKTLHVQMDDITREPVPRRWVELIQHLNEQERKRSERSEPEPQRQ